MGGLIVGVVSIVFGLWFIREKISGREPESNMFTCWFAIGLAGPLTAGFTELFLISLFPPDYLRENKITIIPLVLVVFWIYFKTVEFFGVFSNPKDE